LILRGIESAIIKIFESGSPPNRHTEFETAGLLLGTATQLYDLRRWEKVFLGERDRLKHIYILGSTGSGKSKLIESFIRQDMIANRGFTSVDPHGDLCQNFLKYLASFISQSQDPFPLFEYLSKKLVLIEPFNQSTAIGFNPLEAKGTSSFSLAVELIRIFKKIWQGSHWGARMEELFRSVLLTLSENELTLLEAVPLLTSSSFREKMMQKLTLEEIKDYWLYRYNPLSEAMKSIFREPVLNRLSVFTSDPCIRLMVGQKKSTIDFRKIMDGGKWLIINLSKGQMRENIYLLGGLLIAKLKLAAMSRVDLPEQERQPFIAYIDEFQNFGEEFESILPEARKYGLGLCLAHQNLDQIDQRLRASILGNAATQIFFRLSHHDASHLSSEMDTKEKPIIERKLIDFKVGEAYLKRKGERPRLLRTMHVNESGSNDQYINIIRDLSFANFARPRREVEEEISRRRNMLNIGNGTANNNRSRSTRMRSGLPFMGEMEEAWNEW
jgi:hypothetical protein